MKKLLGIGVVIVLILVLAFWFSNRSSDVNPGIYSGSQNVTTASLDGKIFQLTNYNGTELLNSPYVLLFEDGALNITFCNNMFGQYNLSGDIIQASLIGTDMSCSQLANIMEMESRFGMIMNEGAKISLNGNVLSIASIDNEQTVFVFGEPKEFSN